MAEVTGLRNNALPYPIYGVPYGVTFPMLDADGDLVTGATTPDAEVSKNGDTFADCTNESTEIATSSGVYYLLLTGTEMTADVVTVIAKSATAGMKTTVITLYPRKLVPIRTGTAADDGSGTGDIVLDSGASAVDDYYNGCVCVAVIDSNTEARIIDDYVGSTKTASVTPDWNVAVDNTDTFTIYMPEGMQLPHIEKIYSDTVIITSDLAEVDTSDIRSALTALTTSGGLLSDMASKVTRIHSDTISLASDLAEGDFSDILSRLTVTNSQLLIVKSDTSDIRSALVIIASDTAAIDSNVDKVYSDTTIIYSDTTKIDTQTLDIQSESEVIQSQAVAIRAIVSDIQSDTNVMVPIVSDIQSDTNVLVTKMRGLVLATGTIGATGNTTTVIHIPDAVLDSLSDDEIKYYNVVIYDNSLDEYHVRTITAWTNVGDLATVSPALPFTPEASVDLYWILPPVANQFDYDHSDLYSLLTLVRSDTTVVETVTSDIQSDTNKLVSDATEVDTSDIMSMLTLIRSDTTTLASDLAEGDFSDILSRLTVTNSQLLIVKSDTSDIRSNLAVLVGAGGVISDIASGVDAIQAAGAALTSDQDSKLTAIATTVLVAGTLFEMVSDIYSDTTAIEAAGGALTAAQDSKLTEINSQVVRIHSDTITLASDLAEGDFSDILSRLTVTNSQLLIVKSDTSDIRSNLAAMVGAAGILSDINSGVDAIQAAGAALTSDQDSKLTAVATTVLTGGTLFEMVSDVYSDTTIISSDTAHIESDAAAIEPIVSDIQSDTSDIQSKLVALAAVASDIQSDTNKLVSDATEVDASDILSLLTLVRSDTTVIESQMLVVKSDTSDLKSHLTVVNSETTAIQSKTASLTFTVAGQVDANIEYVNGTEVGGTGALGDEWGPA